MKTFLLFSTAATLHFALPTHAAELRASDGVANDLFGSSVSLSGSIGLVGAFGDDSLRGSAYVFRNLDTASGTITESVKLTASDGVANDYFGLSVSLSGTIGLVGAREDDSRRGSAYVFRDLDTATGAITESVKLTASDRAANDYFGQSVSLSGAIGLVGAHVDDSGQGSAYVFRNLDTATGAITESAKLIASDRATNDAFGLSVSLSGSIGLVGAIGDDGNGSDSGSAYVFLNLDTASGTITESVKLTASDGAGGDNFGYSVSLSGSTGLVGAWHDDDKGGSNSGSAYLFLGLDTASGTINETVKLIASNGAASDEFGFSVTLDGDRFLVGARFGDGVVTNSGTAYSGSVSSLTTLDAGNTSETISRISFTSRTDWIIGETTSGNQVTLSAGDSADVTSPGKGVFIGKNPGADNNTLIINGSLTANSVTVAGEGGRLHVDGSVTTTGGVQVEAGAILSGGGTLAGGDVTILGIHSPGNSSGLQTIDGNLNYGSGSSVVWELFDNTLLGRDTNYDGIDVLGNLTFAGPATLNLVFNGLGSEVDWTDLAFWGSDQHWLLYNVTGTTGGLLDNFNIYTSDWLDKDGRFFNSYITDRGFGLEQVGNDVLLVFSEFYAQSPQAIPEPSRALLLLAGLLGAVLRRRR